MALPLVDDREKLLLVLSAYYWGDLFPQSSRYPIRLSLFPERDERSAYLRFSIEVVVSPFQRNFFGLTYAVPGQRVAFTTSLPPLLLNSRASLDEELVELFRIPDEVPPRLFEADPRIGMSANVRSYLRGPEDSPTPLPKVPLFDPVGGVPPPFSDIRLGSFSTCGRCGSLFFEGESVYWGGGYVRWVCYQCSTGSPR